MRIIYVRLAASTYVRTYIPHVSRTVYFLQATSKDVVALNDGQCRYP